MMHSKRKLEITRAFMDTLNAHLDELKKGQCDNSLELGEIAQMLHIDADHLNDTVKSVTGKSLCDIYEEGMLAISKELITTTNRSMSDIARTLTYDPSNFTKFFKRFTGMTPLAFRKLNTQI